MTYEQACYKALALSQRLGFTCFIYRKGKGYVVQGYQDYREDVAFTIQRSNRCGIKTWSVCKKG